MSIFNCHSISPTTEEKKGIDAHRIEKTSKNVIVRKMHEELERRSQRQRKIKSCRLYFTVTEVKMNPDQIHFSVPKLLNLVSKFEKAFTMSSL